MAFPALTPALPKFLQQVLLEKDPEGWRDNSSPIRQVPGAAFLLRVESSVLFQAGKLAHILVGPRCLSSLEHARRDWVTEHQGVGEALQKWQTGRPLRPRRTGLTAKSFLRAPEPAQTPTIPWGASPRRADPAALFLRKLRVGR